MTFGWCWPQSVRPGESVTLHVEGDRPVEVAVVRDGLTPRLQRRVPGERPHDHDRRGLAARPVPRAARRRRPDRLVRRARCGGDRARAGDQHLERVQRRRRPEPLHRRRRGVVRPPAGARDAGQGRRHAACRPRAATAAPRATRSSRPGTAWPAGPDRSGGSCAGPKPTASTLGYATNHDLEQHPDVLAGCRLLLSVGHDEYWTWGMRDTVDALRRRRRQRRLPLRQHVLLAGARRRRRDGRLQAPPRRGSRAVTPDDDDVGRSDHRPAGGRR